METRARTFQGPRAAAGPDSEGPVSLSLSSYASNTQLVLRYWQAGGGGIRVLLYGIAGDWYSPGCKVLAVAARVAAQQGQSRVVAGQVPLFFCSFCLLDPIAGEDKEDGEDRGRGEMRK